MINMDVLSQEVLGVSNYKIGEKLEITYPSATYSQMLLVDYIDVAYHCEVFLGDWPKMRMTPQVRFFIAAISGVNNPLICFPAYTEEKPVGERISFPVYSTSI
jgi:hypothetical protein